MSSNEAASTEPSRLNGTKIAALLATATPGPWVYSPERHTHDSPIHTASAKSDRDYIGPCSSDGGVVGSSEWIWLQDGDGNFIAAAPDIAARAIDAEAIIRDLVEVLEEIDHDTSCEIARSWATGKEVDRARAFLRVAEPSS